MHGRIFFHPDTDTFAIRKNNIARECQVFFGYGKGVDVVGTLPNDTSAGELGRILKANGLIKDEGIFKIQAFLYDLTITPGTYEFSTEYNVEDIIDIINANKPEEEESGE